MQNHKRMKTAAAVFSLISLALFSIRPALSAPPLPVLKNFDGNGVKFVEDEIIVKYKNDAKRFRVVKVPKNAVGQKIREYAARGDVEYAEPNYIAHAFMEPNDPYYALQWNFDNPVSGGIGTEEAWDVSNGSGATIAVIDTGIAYENYGWRYRKAPDMNNTCFVSGYDFVNNDSHPNDDNAHGTHVAGTIAQSTNNGTGTAGVAFKACMMPIKVLDKNGSGSYADIVEGIYFAADHGASIINLSLGGSADSQSLKDALAYAYDHGVTVVAAAGNDGSGAVSYPAAYDEYVIAVGATRYDETLVSYSNYGPGLDLVAPGGDLNVDQNGDGYGDGILQNTFNPNSKNTREFNYWFFQGTSMAAPHVSGVAGLLVSNGTATAPDDVRAALESTAKDLGDPGRDDTYGWGLVNAPAALAWTSAPPDNPPSVTLTSPADGATVSGTVAVTADAADDHGVTRVDFYADEAFLGSDDAAPYEWSWNSADAADGLHTISATAVDTISQTMTHGVTVTVDNVNDPPAADAGPDKTANDADGNGLETLTLDGSGSFDPDGTIVSYEWKEGGVVLGDSASLTQEFGVGEHGVTLTVTDDEGAVGADTVTVTVLANQAPAADAGPDQSATIGQNVILNGSGSSDPDGTIVSYEWNFGDGNTADGVAASHSYAAEGSYVVTLTITDNGGLTAMDTALVDVSEASIQTMHVGDITFKTDVVSWGWWGSRCRVTASVPVLDGSGSGVNGAAVQADWSGAYSRNVSGNTNGAGIASFQTGWVWGCGTFTFTVNDIVKIDWTYDPSANLETSDSVTLP
jgi:serine protease